MPVLSWSFEPGVMACLLASGIGYAIGLKRVWRAAGVGRGISRWQALWFTLGWTTLALALLSPLDALGLRLFSAHMVQHELLMVIVAPLMCLARPLAAWTWALPPRWRRRVGRWTRATAWRSFWSALVSPLGGFSVHAAVLWGWHAPRLFEAALHDEAVHTLQHASFLAAALVFWWSTLRTAAPAAQGRALVSLFTTMLHTAALGALLTLSATPWYPSYGLTAPALGLEPLDDQQLGGLVMWVPAGLAYVAAALRLAMGWARLRQRTLAGTPAALR